MNPKTIITLAVIGAITILEAYALYLGMDGALFTTVIAVLAGFAGYEIKTYREMKSKN